MQSILIIDDEFSGHALARVLEREGYEVFPARDCRAGIDLLSTHPIQVILCGAILPDGNGADLIPMLSAASPASCVILLASQDCIDAGLSALRNGAFDYMVRGREDGKLVPMVRRAFTVADSVGRQSVCMRQKENPADHSEPVAGTSSRFREVLNLAKKVARTDVPMLFSGEPGVGKKILARSIHQAGPRKESPFVVVNCSAFSTEMLDFELFGHHTDVPSRPNQSRKGAMEEAQHGTLFLEEVGEMAPELQVKLLRVLERGEFLKPGCTVPVKVDVRILSATSSNLREDILSGRFSEDLFFRISIFHFALPSLRDRKEDIPALAHHFMKVCSGGLDNPVTDITPNAMKALLHYSWPGNVLELRRVMERALAVCDACIDVDSLPREFFSDSASSL